MRTRALRAIPLLLVLGACGGSSGDARSAGPSSTAATAPSTTSTSPSTSTSAPSTSTSTTTTTVPALSASSRLRVDGLGPVDVGMTVEQARAAAGVSTNVATGPYCRTLTAPALGKDVLFIATNEGGGPIDVIVVTGGPVKTVSGIGVGSARADVVATYGDRVTAVTATRLVYRARDAGLQGLSLVFVIDHDKVVTMYTGAESHVLQDEMCA